MDLLNKADKNLSRLTNVRIVQLPPYAVASNHCIEENPEETEGMLWQSVYSISASARSCRMRGCSASIIRTRLKTGNTMAARFG